MKRYLTALCMALVACVLSIGTVAATSTASNPTSQIKSVNVSFTSVYTVTKTSTQELCLISGPSGTLVYQNPLVTAAQIRGADIQQCQQALKEIGGELRARYPLVAFNFIINGQQLGLI